ncbi:MAG: HNH endonuclease [Myxococcales bacterium]|nr:HNH endonuclease [Myxococcales bacterium]
MTMSAFLFGWNPARFRVGRWTTMDDLVSAASGDDEWETKSSKPQKGDWAFAVKLGQQGRGFFARGQIVKIDDPPGARDVIVRWLEFLDPRSSANLLAFPAPVGHEVQKWDAQSNGTEIKRYPLPSLHELWDKHYAARSSPVIAGTSDADADINEVLTSSMLTTTEKQQLVRARRGQGLFRENVAKIEEACRVTGVSDRTHLRASHIKPWRAANNKERLDGNNGLLLSPHIDHLFDQGFISFSDDGRLLVSPQLENKVLTAWHIAPKLKGAAFTHAQRAYLAYHRKKVFLTS